MIRSLHCPACGGSLDPEARACPQCGTTSATRRCGICFDINLWGDSSCRSCGQKLPQEDPAHRPERLPCPGCGADMTPRKLRQRIFDECDHCGGLWLCPVTVASVTESAESREQLRVFDHMPGRTIAARPRQPVSYRRCPLCSKMMNRTNYARGSGVVLDVCRLHGSFFDQGEISRLFQFIEQGGLEKARLRRREEERNEMREERRKAILIGASAPGEGREPGFPREITALDLLGWLSEMI